MTRSARIRRREEVEEDDDELVSSHKVNPEEKSSGRRANPLRSKHSETEQRRRIKINERFQVLMDLIPQNDQKRDKASFLLEVIQYVQFLQSRIEMYEGCSQEAAKLIPRRNSSGLEESFFDQPQLIRNESGLEDSYIVTPSMVVAPQNSVDTEVGEAVACGTLNHDTVAANEAIPVRAMAESSGLENVASQSDQAYVSDSDFRLPNSQMQSWPSGPCTIDRSRPSYILNEAELKTEIGEASILKAYSQGLLNNLTQALQSSGVDLTQASISVQLDVGKRVHTGLPTTTSDPNDQHNQCHGVGSDYELSDHAKKRPRT